MADKQQVLEFVLGMLDRLVEKASEYTHLEEENEKLRLALANREEELEDLQNTIANMAKRPRESEAARSMRETGLRSPCIEKSTEGEPTFTLRAKDTLAPEIVREWAFRAKRAGTPKEKTDDARRIADEMEDWQIANQRHVPD